MKEHRMNQADGVAATKDTQSDLSPEFQILDLFRTGLLFVIGPTDVERLTGIKKGTASVKLHALARAEYLVEIPDQPGRYAPGPSMWAISMAYNRTMQHKGLALMTNFSKFMGEFQGMMQMMQTPAGKGN
jgi:DNA-binding IclR family transcriptional regulator